MAYYPYDASRQAVQPITTDAAKEPVRVGGVGAYYAYDASREEVQPINGLGLSGNDQLADEAVRVLIGRRRPVMVARAWARRVTDVVWRDELGDGQLTLLPLTDSEIAAVRRSAHGNDLPLVAILAAEPSRLETSARAFDGTPYVLEDSYAIYSLADRRPLATPLFLYIGRRRDADDARGGNRLMSQVAKSLGGVLVYMIKLPLPAGARGPGASYARARANAGTPAPELRGLSGAGFHAPGALGSLGSLPPAALVGIGFAATVVVAGLLFGRSSGGIPLKW